LGKGRELPEEPKPKRPARVKAASADGAVDVKPASRLRKKGAAGEDEAAAVELKPAATIVKPKPVPTPTEVTAEVTEPSTPVAEIVAEPAPFVPAAPVDV